MRAAARDRSAGWWDQRRALGVCAVCRGTLPAGLDFPLCRVCRTLTARAVGRWTYGRVRQSTLAQRLEAANTFRALGPSRRPLTVADAGQ